MTAMTLVLPSYRGDSRAVFVVGPAGYLHTRIVAIVEELELI